MNVNEIAEAIVAEAVAIELRLSYVWRRYTTNSASLRLCGYWEPWRHSETLALNFVLAQ
jgi:hypothetical protein